MIRFLTFGILFLCYSCHDGKVKLRATELNEQIIYEVAGKNTRKIDSLVELSAGLSHIEHYAVIFKALQYCVELSMEDEAKRYLHQLDSLPYPKIGNKESGFLMLSCYENLGYKFICFAPQMIEPKKIASLLFDMQNRWQLTPQEQIRLLVMKSKIYFLIFNEYKSSALIASDGFRLAQKYNADQQTMEDLYKALSRSFLFLEKDELSATLGIDFEDLAKICPADSSMRNNVYYMIGSLYERQGDYQKAYDWLKKTGRFEKYHGWVVPLYIKMDSIPAALAYLERQKKACSNPRVLAYISADEANVRLTMRDSAEYMRCFQKVVDFYAQGDIYETPTEDYVRLLWQQGKRTEAIRRLEIATGKAQKYIARWANDGVWVFDDLLSKNIGSFRLLRDYYSHVGRTADAVRQASLCDSLEHVLADARLQTGQRKWQAAMYTKDLERNLELRAAELQQGRQRLHFIYLIVGLMTALVVVLWILYRQRERQLNVLYARQKETEQLQAKHQHILRTECQNLSPEEQLFRKLERQFYEEELFRNPGFSRDDLCRLGGSNRMYVSTCINKYAGTNINQWINKARIDYAIRLIGEGEKDLAKISEWSGFSSIKSFFRSFKQFTNLSPRQYIIREIQNRNLNTSETASLSEE